ncbi:MAG: hypothetical protein E7F58_04595 [Clostridium saudiense]|uniref:hypothetical protein n=1 Tax=Clostridium saudiense TaxID=1414720 RepID=UPI002909B093|nr:hypothetical protein [Clostridium saudiense]MDU3520927.1 hypothetical protein [Clostridium saudiense]
MKKFMVLIISLMSFFILSSCTTTNNSSLQGFYQSERTTDGYVIQISIQSDENSFVQYIDNREVNSGTYDELPDKKYKLKGDNQTIEITLDENNSFEIITKKVNGGNPIILKNVDKVPGYFTTEFDDIDKYKLLLEE